MNVGLVSLRMEVWYSKVLLVLLEVGIFCPRDNRHTVRPVHIPDDGELAGILSVVRESVSRSRLCRLSKCFGRGL